MNSNGPHQLGTDLRDWASIVSWRIKCNASTVLLFLRNTFHSLRLGHFLCPNVMINNRCSMTCLSDSQTLSLSSVKQCNGALFYGRHCQHQIAQEICRHSYLCVLQADARGQTDMRKAVLYYGNGILICIQIPSSF